nr:carbonic anhydrase 3 [Chlorocebus sabaeus]
MERYLMRTGKGTSMHGSVGGGRAAHKKQWDLIRPCSVPGGSYIKARARGDSAPRRGREGRSSPARRRATMAKEWGYASHNGPDHWHELFPNAKGENQSPIELHTKDIKHDPSLQPWSVSYDGGSAKTILNNGKTCRVVFDDTYDRSMLRGGPLPGPYRLRQFHLHWGSSDDHGSEHTVDGVKYAAELHLVHWNPKYNTFKEALKQRDGIAVIGIFLKIGREKGEFQIFLDALDKIKTKGKEAPFTKFDPSCLFPACRDYWTYQGSFTTPPCEECIVWLLLKEPMTVSSDQMAKLRSLLSSAENEPPVPLVGNWRPPQPIKNRVVRASFK